MLAVVLVGLVGAFGGIQVGVARDADDVGVLDGVHGEYLGRHHLDGVLQQDELQAAARQLDDALALAGQGDQPQRHAFRPQVLRGLGLLGGRLFGLALVLVGLGVGRVLAALRGLALALGAACRAGARVRAAGGVGFLVQPHHQVQRAVFQVGEGVAGVDDLRRQEGQHVGVHVVAQEGALLVVQVVGAQVAHVGLLQQAAQAFVRALVGGIQLVAAFVDGIQLLGGGHARLGVDDVLLHQRQVGQAAHAHHEELLQVAPEDGDEVQAFQQGHRLVGALVEHAFVEGEPGELAVLQVGLGLRRSGFVHDAPASCHVAFNGWSHHTPSGARRGVVSSRQGEEGAGSGGTPSGFDEARAGRPGPETPSSMRSTR